MLSQVLDIYFISHFICLRCLFYEASQNESNERLETNRM